MKIEIRFTFIGGDNRQRHIISLLAQQGFQINALGWKDMIHENIRIFQELDLELFDCNVLMLPIPYCDKNGNIKIFSMDIALKLDMLMENLKPGTIIIFGKEDQAFVETASKYSFSCYDILKEESFSVLNAIPTAEGAIQRAMERTDITLHSANTLVLGYGRIGKVLSRMLYGIGSRVAVMARKNEDVAWIMERGYEVVPLDELDYVLGKQNIIFNTIPSMILNRTRLAKISPQCVIIDLASIPGGVDFEAARKLGIHASHDLSLPGVVAPKSAAHIIYQVIKEIIRRHYQYDIIGGDGLAAGR